MDRNEIEGIVKDLIRESLEKRLEGMGPIDNILNNSALIERWLTDIMVLGYNHGDIEAAVKEVYEVQYPYVGEQSFEELRNRLYLSSNRFWDEIMAYQSFADHLGELEEEDILALVEKWLEPVEPGNFMLS